MAKENMKMDKMQDKKLIKKAFGMHDKQEHKGEKTDLSTLKKGGMPKMKKGGCAKMAKGGGIESKGKTKGRIV